MARVSNWTAHVERPASDYPDYFRAMHDGFESVEDFYLSLELPRAEDKYIEIEE